MNNIYSKKSNSIKFIVAQSNNKMSSSSDRFIQALKKFGKASTTDLCHNMGKLKYFQTLSVYLLVYGLILALVMTGVDRESSYATTFFMTMIIIRIISKWLMWKTVIHHKPEEKRENFWIIVAICEVFIDGVGASGVIGVLLCVPHDVPTFVALLLCILLVGYFFMITAQLIDLIPPSTKGRLFYLLHFL